MENQMQNTIILNGEDSEDLQSIGREDDFLLTCPKLYICYGRIIENYILEGRQTVGRRCRDCVPDIAIENPYISKQHGFFETVGNRVCYIADSTTNGIYIRNRQLAQGERIELYDGDELRIPVKSKDAHFAEILLICAKMKPRDMMWQAFQYACLDCLTKLQNRGAFRDRFDCIPDGSLCLYMIDIDRFKQINDKYGHGSGDKAIKALVSQLCKAINDKYLSRWGGDEFVGMLDENLETTQRVIEMLRKRVSQLEIEGKFHITISVGLVEVSDVRGKYAFEELVELADRELYKAKEAGGNCVSSWRCDQGKGT